MKCIAVAVDALDAVLQIERHSPRESPAAVCDTVITLLRMAVRENDASVPATRRLAWVDLARARVESVQQQPPAGLHSAASWIAWHAVTSVMAELEEDHPAAETDLETDAGDKDVPQPLRRQRSIAELRVLIALLRHGHALARWSNAASAVPNPSLVVQDTAAIKCAELCLDAADPAHGESNDARMAYARDALALASDLRRASSSNTSAESGNHSAYARELELAHIELCALLELGNAEGVREVLAARCEWATTSVARDTQLRATAVEHLARASEAILLHARRRETSESSGGDALLLSLVCPVLRAAIELCANGAKPSWSMVATLQRTLVSTVHANDMIETLGNLRLPEEAPHATSSTPSDPAFLYGPLECQWLVGCAWNRGVFELRSGQLANAERLLSTARRLHRRFHSARHPQQEALLTEQYERVLQRVRGAAKST
jgi:hypothetical protein